MPLSAGSVGLSHFAGKLWGRESACYRMRAHIPLLVRVLWELRRKGKMWTRGIKGGKRNEFFLKNEIRNLDRTCRRNCSRWCLRSHTYVTHTLHVRGSEGRGGWREGLWDRLLSSLTRPAVWRVQSTISSGMLTHIWLQILLNRE